MALVAEKRSTGIYVVYCPKCGLVVPDPSLPCPWCLYSEETALTKEEAKEFTTAGD